jgi:hypothetical protein
MRTLGTRRAVLVAGVAGVAAAALVGCGAGQVAETALKNPSVYGVNAQNATGSVLVRGLAVAYKDPAGYPAGSNAPLELTLVNETRQPVTVLVSSQPPADAAENSGIVSARSVNLFGGSPSAPSTAIPEPSGSRPAATPDTETSDNVVQPSGEASAGPSGTSPSAQPSPTPAASGGRPARIEIGPLSTASFLPGDAETLQVVGLTDRLFPGGSVNLVFEFGDGSAPLVVQAPMAIPLSPASRAPGNPEEHSGETNPDEEN